LVINKNQNTELRKSGVAYSKGICHPSNWWYVDSEVGMWPSTWILVQINPKSGGTLYTRVGTLIVATIYLQLIQN